jgi:hypothetical protein
MNKHDAMRMLADHHVQDGDELGVAARLLLGKPEEWRPLYEVLDVIRDPRCRLTTNGAVMHRGGCRCGALIRARETDVAILRNIVTRESDVTVSPAGMAALEKLCALACKVQHE